MDLLDGLIPADTDISSVHYERIFIFSLMWSFGALLELEDRSKMESFLVKHKPKLDLPKRAPGGKETIFEFLVDSEGIGFNFCLNDCEHNRRTEVKTLSRNFGSRCRTCSVT